MFSKDGVLKKPQNSEDRMTYSIVDVGKRVDTYL